MPDVILDLVVIPNATTGSEEKKLCIGHFRGYERMGRPLGSEGSRVVFPPKNLKSGDGLASGGQQQGADC